MNRVQYGAAGVFVALCMTAAGSTSPSYFTGLRSIQTANGELQSDVPVAVVLDLRPLDSSIVEQIVSPAIGDQPSVRVFTLRVSGSTFRVTERDGLMVGRGSLRGDSWKWNGWDATNTLPDGITVEVSDSLTSDSLISHQRISAPGGRWIGTTVDRMARSDSTRFELVRARVLAGDWRR